VIINQQNEYTQLITRMNREMHLCTPIFRDINKHSSVNDILCVGYTFFNGDFYLVSISHTDAPNFEYPQNTFLTFDSDRITSLGYVMNIDFPELDDSFTPYVKDTRMVFRNVRDLNRIPPITAWSSIISHHHNIILKKLNGAEDIFRLENSFVKSAVKTLRRIERSGLAVDEQAFDVYFSGKDKRFITNGLVYSQYYPYTMTGRPSNAFGGINFAALNKKDGSRSVFISRFEHGQLLQLDFESYHLRLIANLMNVDLPNEPVHQYLAKQYYGKDSVTQEEYDEGKQITFSILYGADVDTSIPLLQNIKKLSSSIYQEYLDKKVIWAYHSKRRIFVPEEDATENKLFNYFVQNYEFESTVPRLKELLDYLNTKQSKLVLYTYDAVLIDCHPDELAEIHAHANAILGANKYPLRSYTGSNYNELKEIVSTE